jgi:hypothetical protein
MLINEAYLYRFRNEGHYEFMFNAIELMMRFPAVSTLLFPYIAELSRLLEIEKKIIDRHRKSAITLLLEVTDKRIDRAIVGINSLIRGMLHHPSPDAAEMARQLEIRKKEFGKITRKAYEEEAAAVQELIDELTGAYSPHVAALGLMPWVEELGQAETEFVQLFRQRNTELTNWPAASMSDIRGLVDDQYRASIRRIESYIDLNGPEGYLDFVRELNENIKYFNEHAHHRTRRDIEHTLVNEIPAQPFTGKPVIYIPTVFFTEPDKPAVELAFSVDFTVTYKDNVAPGTATILIHGKSKYKGTKIVTFNIEGIKK